MVNWGNSKVVHPVILYAKWPGSPRIDSKGAFFVGWAPATRPLDYSEGVAKKLSVRAKLTIEMHYTTNGSEQTDESEIAIYLLDKPATRNA